MLHCRLATLSASLVLTKQAISIMLARPANLEDFHRLPRLFCVCLAFLVLTLHLEQVCAVTALLASFPLLHLAPTAVRPLALHVKQGRTHRCPEWQFVSHAPWALRVLKAR